MQPFSDERVVGTCDVWQKRVWVGLRDSSGDAGEGGGGEMGECHSVCGVMEVGRACGGRTAAAAQLEQQ